MSRQEMKAYGKQEFRKFPMVTMEPLPETLDDYIKNNLMGKGGIKAKDVDRHLICQKTGKDYLFWDNMMLHYKKLHPLYGKPIDFDLCVCPHDQWQFYRRDNLKLHNKVVGYETQDAIQVERRLNLDNPDWVVPCDRADRQPVNEDDEQDLSKSKKKKSRFLKKSSRFEPPKPKKSYSDDEDEELSKKLHVAKKVEKVPHYVKNHWPWNPDDLPAIPRPPEKNVPEYQGWTHSDNADSWFLEAHTPSQYEPYENWYHNALKQKIVCPKLYAMSFGTA